MVRTPSRLALLAVVATIVLLTGCGSSSEGSGADGPTTTAAAKTTTTEAGVPATTEAGQPDPSGDPLCAPLKVLSDFDKQSATVIAQGSWTDIQAFFVQNTDEVLVGYDAAIALDTELSADLTQLRGVTAETASLATEATSLEDLSEQLLAQPDITAAGEAGYRVSAYAEANCGFATGSNAAG